MNEQEAAIALQFNDRLRKIYKLKNVVRYNTRNVLSKENVAEHCFNVAAIALTLCDMHNIKDHAIREMCLVKALLHDMPETKFNDITHDVKEALGLRPLLKEHEDKYYEQEFPLQAELMNSYMPVVNEIVDYADVLSVKQYVANERELGNNSQDISEIEQGLYTRIEESRALMLKAIKTYIDDKGGLNGTLA